MGILSGHIMSRNQAFPLLLERDFRQEHKQTLDRSYLCYRLCCGETQTVLMNRSRGHRPELNQVLRGYIECFTPASKYLNRILSYSGMRMLRL